MGSKNKYHLKFFKQGITKADLIDDGSLIAVRSDRPRVFVNGHVLLPHFDHRYELITLMYVTSDGVQGCQSFYPGTNSLWEVNNLRFEVIASIRDVHGLTHMYFIRHNVLTNQLEDSHADAYAKCH